MAHTPGPWTPVQLRSGHTAIATETMGHIANVHETLHAQGAANARLIAAAPALLIAACDALKVARRPQDFTEEQHEAILEAVEAAIASAEGV